MFSATQSNSKCTLTYLPSKCFYKNKKKNNRKEMSRNGQSGSRKQNKYDTTLSLQCVFLAFPSSPCGVGTWPCSVDTFWDQSRNTKYRHLRAICFLSEETQPPRWHLENRSQPADWKPPITSQPKIHVFFQMTRHQRLQCNVHLERAKSTALSKRFILYKKKKR